MNNQSNVTHLSAAERTVARPVPRRTHDAYQPRPAEVIAPKRFVAKGHDSQLQQAQYEKTPVLVISQGGMEYTGVIVRRDRYTVTLTLSSGLNAGRQAIVYKHAIEVLIPLTPVDAETEGA